MSLSYIFWLFDKYFEMSYTYNIQTTSILECHMYGISKSQIFVSGIFYGYPIPVCQGPLLPWKPCGAFGPGSTRPSPHHPLTLRCAAPQSESVSATDRSHRHRRVLATLPQPLVDPNCHSHWLISYTLLSFLPDSSETWRSCAGGAGAGWSE